MNKLNNYIKPSNVQIISKAPLERVQIDITYFKSKLNIKEIENKYLLNLTDHFGKFSKGYIIDNKSSECAIEKLKIYIKEVGLPKILYSDNGAELLLMHISYFV